MPDETFSSSHEEPISTHYAHLAALLQKGVHTLTQSKPIPSNSRITRLCSHSAHRLSDMGNAELFIDLFGSQVRYVPEHGWFFFTGTHWQHDASDHLLYLAHSSLQSYSDLASSLTNEDEALCTRLLKHVERSSSPARLKALLSLARTLPGITIPLSSFDAHPHLLTVLNGTLDLTTLQLLPHQSAHLLTRFIPIAYDPTATSSLWHTFLTQLTNHDAALAHYLLVSVGSSLTGHPSPGFAFLLQGPDQRPHHLFLSLLCQFFGSYAHALPALKPRFLTPALLQGARLLTCTSLPFLHGCDPTTLSTLLHATPILTRSGSPAASLQPQATLWLSSPQALRLPAPLSSLSSSVKVIPTGLILTEDYYRQLSTQLFAALPALLTWAAQGARAWLASGLEEPASVTAASRAFQEDQDDLSSFLEACCDQQPTHVIPARDLYLAYSFYSRSQGQRPLSEHTFIPCLLARPFTRSHSAPGRLYHGLRLSIPLPDLLAQFQQAIGHPASPARQLKTLLTRSQLPSESRSASKNSDGSC